MPQRRRWSKAFENAATAWVQIVTEKSVGLAEMTGTVSDDLARVIRSAVRATHPGRQQGPNMAKLMAAAERAATRALNNATKRAVG